MFNIGALCPRHPGSNPGWSAARLQIDIEVTCLQAYDQAMLIVFTVTVRCLVGITK